ncbi:MAG: hypothetical protein R2851_07025 [Caldilineaceae bacterium]
MWVRRDIAEEIWDLGVTPATAPATDGEALLRARDRPQRRASLQRCVRRAAAGDTAAVAVGQDGTLHRRQRQPSHRRARAGRDVRTRAIPSASSHRQRLRGPRRRRSAGDGRRPVQRAVGRGRGRRGSGLRGRHLERAHSRLRRRRHLRAQVGLLQRHQRRTGRSLCALRPARHRRGRPGQPAGGRHRQQAHSPVHARGRTGQPGGRRRRDPGSL